MIIIHKIDTWDVIKKQYYQVATEQEGRQYRTNIQEGVIASPMNPIRLFHNDTSPRVIFYR
jgi:hypothetical protein